jgi:hypothetical protein
VDREGELAVLSRQQRETDSRIQSLLERFSSIEGSLKDLTNTVTLNPTQSSSSTPRGSYKKLPNGISVKVKSFHTVLAQQFDPKQKYQSPYNQSVVSNLTSQMTIAGTYTREDIKSAIYRYYESRRRKYRDEQLDRQGQAAQNNEATKSYSRKRRLFEKRKKACKHNAEVQAWSTITPHYMSEEESDEDEYVIHKPTWRSSRFINLITKLDRRRERQTLTNHQGFHPKQRREGTPSTRPPPADAKVWTLSDAFLLSRRQEQLRQSSLEGAPTEPVTDEDPPDPELEGVDFSA